MPIGRSYMRNGVAGLTLGEAELYDRIRECAARGVLYETRADDSVQDSLVLMDRGLIHQPDFGHFAISFGRRGT